MDVKSQLIDAQVEHVLDAAKGTPKKARLVYATDTDKLYMGDGSTWILLNNSHLGDTKTSILDEATFQTLHGNTWILADGRDVTGSDYHSLTGIAFVPDMRGQFLRGKNNGRADGKQNPDGELALGSYQADEFKSHGHNYAFYFSNNVNFGGADAHAVGAANTFNVNRSIDATGGNETRGKNITVNFFIKINK